MAIDGHAICHLKNDIVLAKSGLPEDREAVGGQRFVTLVTSLGPEILYIGMGANWQGGGGQNQKNPCLGV